MYSEFQLTGTNVFIIIIILAINSVLWDFKH